MPSAFESLIVIAGRKPEKGRVRVCTRCVTQLQEAGVLSGEEITAHVAVPDRADTVSTTGLDR